MPTEGHCKSLPATRVEGNKVPAFIRVCSSTSQKASAGPYKILFEKYIFVLLTQIAQPLYEESFLKLVITNNIAVETLREFATQHKKLVMALLSKSFSRTALISGTENRLQRAFSF